MILVCFGWERPQECAVRSRWRVESDQDCAQYDRLFKIVLFEKHSKFVGVVDLHEAFTISAYCITTGVIIIVEHAIQNGYA